MADNRYVIIIPPIGTPKLLHCYPDDTLSLEELQAIVDGYIETVPCLIPDRMVSDGGYVTMIVNEEGKIMELPHNDLASDLVSLFYSDYIAGNAILMRAHGDELTGFLEEDANRIVEEYLIREGELEDEA